MIKVKVLSKADSVEGQGVGSVYIEQKKLIQENSKKIELIINDKKYKDEDLVHIHSINYSYYRYMKKTKKPVIVYVHFVPKTLKGSIRFPLYIKWAGPIFKRYVKKFYKRADYLVVVNPHFVKELVAMGISESKIIFVPNFVDDKSFKLTTSTLKKKYRKKYGYKDSDFICFSAGQIQTRKGVKDFIEVGKQMPNIKFIWAGGFSFKKLTDGYKKLNKAKENAPENVYFPGIIPRTQITEILAISDLMFFPSYDELMPMAILEAMSTGMPLLLRDIEPYKPILKGLYEKASSNDEFIKKIKEFQNKPEKLQKYKNLSIKGSKKYSKIENLKIWESIYSKVVNNNKGKK